MAHRINGIELGPLNQTIDALREEPSLGQCELRAHNHWLGQTHTLSRIQTYHGLNQEMEHPMTFELHSDEPTFLGGDDSTVNPVETMLSALLACLTSSLVVHATLAGISIEGIESEVEGDLDLNGFAGLQDVPVGLSAIRVKLIVSADASSDQLRQMAERSPTFNTLRGGTDLELEVINRAGGQPSRSRPGLQPRV